MAAYAGPSSSRSPALGINGHAYASASSATRATNGLAAPGQSMDTHDPTPTGPSEPRLQVPGASRPVTTAATLMREGTRDFTVIRDVGDGSFGTVCLADWHSPLPSGTLLSPMQHPTTRPEYVGKRLVAIKKMKKQFKSWEECMTLKELKSLLEITAHPNIIPLYDAFLMPVTKELHFVFECMEGNLYQLIKSRKGRPLAGGLLASIFQQIIRGLHHIHESGYFHRDMKPENLLITTTGLTDYPSVNVLDPVLSKTPQQPDKDVVVIVKLADFGLARETASKPPYTEYVSTRWYRAPEVLLRSRDYSNPVDMWALGTILSELITLKPLFPGQSEVDQVMQINHVLGDPSAEYGKDSRGRVRGGGHWPGGIEMARQVGFTFPKAKPFNFAALFKSNVPLLLIECVQDLIRYDPDARLTTLQCMQHPYYTQVAPRLLPPQARAPAPQPTPSQRVPQAHPPPIPADRMAVDPASPQRALPPSHSNQPQSSKLAFGAKSGAPELPSKAQAARGMPGAPSAEHRVPFYPQAQHTMQEMIAEARLGPVSQTATSPYSEQGPGDMTQWAPVAGPSVRDSSMSQYPAFPESASIYSGSHASMHLDDSLSRQRMHAPPIELGGRGPQQARGMVASSSQRTVYDDSLSLSLEQEDRRRQAAAAAAAGISGNEPMSQDMTGTAEYSGERRRSKGWSGMSVFGRSSQTPAQTQAAGAPRQAQAHGAPIALDSGSNSNINEPTAAQRIAAEHATPKDAKKAKKEAEKAAREAEKAKRLAQEKAARDRARAVMQKRNQILASSNSREQVEWLGDAVTQSMSPSDKARGKQPMGVSGITSPTSGGPRVSGSDYSGGPSPMSSNFTNNYGTPPTSMYQNSSMSAAWQARDGDASFRAKARRRDADDDHSMSSLDGVMSDPRRGSMATFTSQRSDPLSQRPHHPGSGHLHRQGSAISVGSAPSLIDHQPGRFMTSLESARQAGDNRSLSSLENQFAGANLAEMRARTPGSASPGPNNIGATRRSVSRGSARGSLHRAGSASPLHHTAAPRFHPYGLTGGTTSPYNFSAPPLPPIAAGSGNNDYISSGGSGSGSTHPATPGRPRSGMRRRSSNNLPRGMSRGSAGSSHGGVEFPPFNVASVQPQMTMQTGAGGVNPMFQVGAKGAGAASQQHQQLPPFSELAAAADTPDEFDSFNRSMIGRGLQPQQQAPHQHHHSSRQ
ncbi:kinase-like protein [Ceraceosorus guamensis]|uniref:Kinase-like protein n=1 Tax=Ceraceosorus guamensis TaxID=1522189 RepID=A0A316W6Z4_9BASI|nr:kinase-like protein [Ceraceosorus guamensis]PWN44898.1 kinase-like protein [Ceraceosorus guamensis]